MRKVELRTKPRFSGSSTPFPTNILNGGQLGSRSSRKSPPLRRMCNDLNRVRSELLWKWRTVLPLDRQEALVKSGDPDAWHRGMMASDESPLKTADFAERPVAQVVVFLKDWQPEPEPSRQTVTALAQVLRTAVVANPKEYSDLADQFAGLKPIYVRRLVEGLQQAAANQNAMNWSAILKLIAFIYTTSHEQIDPATLSAGDDQSWSWARRQLASCF